MGNEWMLSTAVEDYLRAIIDLESRTGIVIGLPTLRLRGDYLAIVTLGFGEILPQIARNGDNLFGTGFNLTNGPNGITPIDAPGFGERLHDWTAGFLPANFLTAENAERIFYWGALVLLLITVFCSWRMRDSRLGRAWVAIREDEIAAAAMGVPLMRTKTWATPRARSSAASPAPTTRPSRARRSRATSSSTSRSSSSAWSSSAGWGTSGASSSAPPSSRTSTARGSRTSAAG